MESLRERESPRRSFGLVVAMVAMVAVPMALTLHTVRVSSVVELTETNPAPYGYTVSLLLFLIPILVIGLWLVPQEQVKISKKAFWVTIGVLFPLGAALDFFFAHLFLTFPKPSATVGIRAPAIGGGVPVEEYLFYLMGFIAVLLMYIWLDEYWLRAYTVPAESRERWEFERLLRFHPESLVLGVVLVGAAIFYKRVIAHEPDGFPGYFTFLAVGSGAFGDAVSYGASGGELAGVQPDVLHHSADERALGGYAGGAVWMVGLSGAADDGAAGDGVGGVAD